MIVICRIYKKGNKIDIFALESFLINKTNVIDSGLLCWREDSEKQERRSFAFPVFHFMKSLNEDILLLTSKYDGIVTRCATVSNVAKYAASKFKGQGCRKHIEAIIPLKLF